MALCTGNSMTGTSGINGDNFYISPDNTTFLLADGASGAGKEGKVTMSAHCVNIIKEHPFGALGLSPDAYLDTMIWKINNDLIEISQQTKTYTFGTLVLCVVHDDTAIIASVGDSPAYFIQDSHIKRIAKPQKTYQGLIDAGFLTETEAESYIEKLHDYMQSMFDKFIPMVVPEYTIESIPLTADDMMMLCSDGIGDFLTPEEIKNTINPNQLENSITTVMNTAKTRSIQKHQRNFYDDITAIIYRH